MTKRFPMSDIASIQQTEQSVYLVYRSILETYAIQYSHYGVKLNITVEWESGGKSSSIQPKIDSTYKAFVVCQGIDSKGNIIESSDHDFYFDFAWPLSTYDKGQVVVYTDVDNDVYELLKTCSEYFEDPY